MGWVMVPTDRTQLGARLARCRICGPGKQQEYLERICGLTREMRTWTLANTERLGGNAEAYDAVEAAAGYPTWFLTLRGAYGVGKTRLLSVLVNEGRALGWTSVYSTMADLLDHLRAAYAPGAPVAFDGLWELVKGCTILALDELDRWNATPWAQEKFFELIDARYRSGDVRLTAVATNAQWEELPGYLVSRLRDRRCKVCEILNSDRRLVER